MATDQRSGTAQRFRKIVIELPNGLAVRHYRARFNAKRWINDRGVGREGDGRRFRRIRMYQWPFGVLHVLGRWDRA